jgi:hypothetical protein
MDRGCERSGGSLLVVEGFIFGGCKHLERAVTALAVVEDLEILEEGVGELETGPPSLTVE